MTIVINWLCVISVTYDLSYPVLLLVVQWDKAKGEGPGGEAKGRGLGTRLGEGPGGEAKGEGPGDKAEGEGPGGEAGGGTKTRLRGGAWRRG